ncbi:MAG: M23 family metallopeptidase [Polyangiales bacterium]
MLRNLDEEEPPLRHRPLPSVDFALLPHELRAIRAQRRAVAAAVIGLVLIAVGLTYGRRAVSEHLLALEGGQAKSEEPAPLDLDPADILTDGAPSAREAPGSSRSGRSASLVSGLPRRSQAVGTTETSRSSVHAAPISSSDVASPDGSLNRTEYKFGRAKSFHGALLACGASQDEADALVGALQKLVDFRRGKPEDRLIFERDADEQLHAFEYRAGITEIYRAVRSERGALRGLRVEVPVEHRRIAKGVFIAGTLGHSLDALGLSPSLAGTVTEALGTKISFTRDTRTGDSVKIILDEEYVDGTFWRYGAVHALEYTSERAGKLQAFWFEPERGDGDFYDVTGRALHGGWMRTPVRYDHVSSPFNLKRRHPILKRIMPHLGIDYSAGTGTPVWAAADGQVTFAGPRGANGNLVSVRHTSGYETHYAHLWKIGTGIKPGAQLKQRQVLGYVGSTGRSTGPHLHFAIKRAGRFLDPVTQFNSLGEPLASGHQQRFRAVTERLRAELEQVPLAAAPSVEIAPKPDDVEEEEDLDL